MSTIATGVASQFVLRNVLPAARSAGIDARGPATGSPSPAQPSGRATPANAAGPQSVRTDAQRTQAADPRLATGAAPSSTQRQNMPGTLPDPAEPAPLTPEDYDGLVEAWGSRTGEEAFDGRFDLSGDGRIDGADLGLFLLQVGGPVRQRFDQSDLQGLVDSFGAQSGDDRFRSEYDLNSDGRIDNDDLHEMLGRYDGPADFAELAPHLARLRDAWGAQAGQEAYRSEYDFNDDGLIDGADLGRLLLGARPGDQESAPSPAEPVHTVAHPVPEASDGLAIGAAAAAGQSFEPASPNPTDRSTFFPPGREPRQTPITVSQRLAAETLQETLLERLTGGD